MENKISRKPVKKGFFKNRRQIMFGAGRSEGLGEDTGHLHVAFMETLRVKTTEAKAH